MRRPLAPSPRTSADGRPRVYLRPTIGGTHVAWRVGMGGGERSARSAGEAVNAALESLAWAPAVIFWEGAPDGED